MNTGKSSGLRIIPADAGSTDMVTTITEDNADHPRGCGEHMNSFSLVRKAKGSSPRMRGALAKIGHHLWKVRIIPADAGSTDWWRPS